jgi:hypothetical protein
VWLTVREVVERVASGTERSLVVQSSAGRRLWVQVSRVDGDDALLCETVGSEYLGRGRELSDLDQARLRRLGWRDASDSFISWVDAETGDDRSNVANMLADTLVDVLGHDPNAVPRVAAP